MTLAFFMHFLFLTFGWPVYRLWHTQDYCVEEYVLYILMFTVQVVTESHRKILRQKEKCNLNEDKESNLKPPDNV